MAIAIASRAAGREPPIDTVWVDLKDTRGLADSVARARALGFQGKLCVHPGQLAVVNKGFVPTDSEIEAAKRIAAAFRSAEGEGLAAIQVDGRLVDYPIARRAERLLEMHSQL